MNSLRRCFYSGLLLTAISAAAENPLGLREYPQTLVRECATHEQAVALTLRPLPLPAPYKLAFSTRWDDSHPGHANTLAIMNKNGIHGTFYLNGMEIFDQIPPERFLQSGDSFGIHTATHPDLTKISTDRQFYEFMANKIAIECATGRPVNTQVFPFCAYADDNPQTQKNIGIVMRMCGILGGPTIHGASLEAALGYPKNTLASTKLLYPGDHVPDLELAQQQLEEAENQPELLAVQPSISIGIHSWHTEEGLKKLDQLFQLRSGRPDYWYCNQSEYSAYRYEANQVKIEKSLRQNTVEFRITRFDPADLGADVPLSLELLQNNLPCETITLPHDPAFGLPAAIVLDRYQNVELHFVPGPEGTFLTVENNTEHPLRELRIILRSSPEYADCMQMITVPELAPQNRLRHPVDFGKRETPVPDETEAKKFAEYQTAQLDFLLEDERIRIYAEQTPSDDAKLSK